MPSLLSIGTALAPHHYAQAEMAERIKVLYRDAVGNLEQIDRVFANAQVAQRHFIQPIEQVLAQTDMPARNRIFATAGLDLAVEAAQHCLTQVQADPQSIDHLLFVSTTGFVVPSLDTYLIERLRLRRDVARVPIFGWGCSGGAAAVALAARLVQADPQARVLVVILELCSLAFQERDVSQKAMISSAIFNDGAAAVLLAGEGGPRVVGSHRHLFPRSEDLMGWEQVPTGLQVILSPAIPELVEQETRPFVERLLAQHGRELSELQVVLSHPGGAKILQAVEAALADYAAVLEHSWETLREVGNISACSIIFVLQRAMRQGYPSGTLGMLSAFGPGFAAEGVLLQW